MTSVSAASSSNRFMRRLPLFRECRLEPVDKEFDRFWSGSAIGSESDGSKLQLPLHVGGPSDLWRVSSIPRQSCRVLAEMRGTRDVLRRPILTRIKVTVRALTKLLGGARIQCESPSHCLDASSMRGSSSACCCRPDRCWGHWYRALSRRGLRGGRRSHRAVRIARHGNRADRGADGDRLGTAAHG